MNDFSVLHHYAYWNGLPKAKYRVFSIVLVPAYGRPSALLSSRYVEALFLVHARRQAGLFS